MEVLELTRVQPDTNATSMEASLMTVPPGLVVSDDDFAEFAADSGLNGPFLAKLLSSSFTHENMGINMWRALDSMTANPAMRPKFKSFREDSETAVQVWATLIESLGGNPHFASPIARVTETMDNKILEALGVAAGSTEAAILDLKGIEAAMLGSHMCVFNVDMLEDAAGSANEGSAKDLMLAAVQQLRPPAEEHYSWCRNTIQQLIATQAASSLSEKLVTGSERVVAKVKDAIKGDE